MDPVLSVYTGSDPHVKEDLRRMLLNAMVCTRVREIQETLSAGVISSWLSA